jgi:hypothetical protein
MQISTKFRMLVVELCILPALLFGIQPTWGQGSVVPKDGASRGGTPNKVEVKRPVLAFYYPWYRSSEWCLCHMSDLPRVRYSSSDDVTIDRQLREAAYAGITGFISSWWGAGDKTDRNFATLLTHTERLEKQNGYRFASSIYFESDAPTLSGKTKTVNALRYLISHYANNPHFFHWGGKPVIFFWNPRGNGRTLAYWAAIRRIVDPNHRLTWSAEGVDMDLLDVFDGIHLFSGGYWGLLHGTMKGVDQGFRHKVDEYNEEHHTHKIWAAGIVPGYDDTRVPGRQGAYRIARNKGKTYRVSWEGAISSNPEWITITSYNEWYEGSMIEPSKSYGNLYLDITRRYT